MYVKLCNKNNNELKNLDFYLKKHHCYNCNMITKVELKFQRGLAYFLLEL